MNERLLKCGHVVLILLTLVNSLLWFISLRVGAEEEILILGFMLVLIVVSLLSVILAHYFLKKQQVNYIWQRQQIVSLLISASGSLVLLVIVFCQGADVFNMLFLLLDSILLLLYPIPIGYQHECD